MRILSRFLRMPRLYGSENLSLQVSANRRWPKDSPFPGRTVYIIVLEGNEKTIVETKGRSNSFMLCFQKHHCEIPSCKISRVLTQQSLLLGEMTVSFLMRAQLK